MSVSHYDIEQVAVLIGPDGRYAYGSSPHDGRGRPLLGARGRPLIQLSNLALPNTQTAVVTIFHEVAHHRSYRAVGHEGSEAVAEQYGQRMLAMFGSELGLAGFQRSRRKATRKRRPTENFVVAIV
jgi:hypothetical protein